MAIDPLQTVDYETHIKTDLENDSVESPVSKPQIVDHETQTTETTLDNRIQLLERKVKSLRQKLRRKDVKISTMEVAINRIKKSGPTNESLDTVLKRYFKGRHFLFNYVFLTSFLF